MAGAAGLSHFISSQRLGTCSSVFELLVAILGERRLGRTSRSLRLGLHRALAFYRLHFPRHDLSQPPFRSNTCCGGVRLVGRTPSTSIFFITPNLHLPCCTISELHQTKPHDRVDLLLPSPCDTELSPWGHSIHASLKLGADLCNKMSVMVHMAMAIQNYTSMHFLSTMMRSA